MEFFKQEYWSGLPFSSPGDLSDTIIKPGSPALQADSLPYGTLEKSLSAVGDSQLLMSRISAGDRPL